MLGQLFQEEDSKYMREATRHDKLQIKAMLIDFSEESQLAVTLGVENFGKDEYLDHLLDKIIVGHGIIYLAEDRGLIMGMFTPSVWCDKTLTLHELAWYVKPEFRGSTIGYRLFKAFISFGNRMKASGRIKHFVMGKMASSPAIKYDKFGFKKIDESWIQ